MTLLTTLTRTAGLGLCVVALAGTALADPGNGNGNGPAVTPPGQEQKAETPAANAPAPAAAPAAAPENNGQEKKAEKAAARTAKPAPAAASKGQAKKDEKQAAKAESKSAKPAPGSQSQGRSDEAHHHVIVCHRTGSDSNPYVVINIPLTAWNEAHSPDTGSHPDLNGRHDILLKDPASGPGSKDGFTKADCEARAGIQTPPQPAAPSSEQPQPIVPTAAGETPAPGTIGVLPAVAPVAPAPAGEVLGAVSPTQAPAADEQPAGGVLGAVASAPEAIARTATSGNLPFTGLPLWLAALVGAGLLTAGLALRRSA